MKCCANIYFNKECIAQKITPAYAKIKVAQTSPASTVTQQKVHVMLVKDEIMFLCRKKEHLNKELYALHLKAASEWGTLWDTLSKTINAYKITYSFSRGDSQTALGILHACNVSWLCHDCSFTAGVAQPTDIAPTQYTKCRLCRAQ
jgi:hypothetical protein